MKLEMLTQNSVSKVETLSWQMYCWQKFILDATRVLVHSKFASICIDKDGHTKKEKISISKKRHLAIFCIDRTAKLCYDYVRIMVI